MTAGETAQLYKMKRKQIKETQKRELYNLTGNIQEVIEWLESVKNDRWETIEYDSGGEQLIFTRYRLETDKELEKRKKDLQKQKDTAAKIKAQREEQDRLLYEELKKKFEK